MHLIIDFSNLMISWSLGSSFNSIWSVYFIVFFNLYTIHDSTFNIEEEITINFLFHIWPSSTPSCKVNCTVWFVKGGNFNCTDLLGSSTPKHHDNFSQDLHARFESTCLTFGLIWANKWTFSTRVSTQTSPTQPDPTNCDSGFSTSKYSIGRLLLPPGR